MPRFFFACFYAVIFVAICSATHDANAGESTGTEQKHILIEGWNEYLHSFSIVNTFHMVHLHPYQFEPNASVVASTLSTNVQTSHGATGPTSDSSGKRATVCRPMPDDGTASVPAGRARTCRLRMTFFEMPPYLMHWTKAGHSKLLNVPEHIDRIRSVPALRASSALPANSQQYMPPNEHYYDLVRLPNDDVSAAAHADDGVERFELRWRFDAIFRIAAPLNMKLPFVPASTSRRIITSPHPPPRVFQFITSEDRALYDKDNLGGMLSAWANSCRAGHIIPITPSKWSQKAIIDLGVRTSIVLPHGVDTSVMHPGLRAEALEYHRRAGMPEAMVSDERSVTFMKSGAMTQNKNAQGLIHAFFMLDNTNPHVYLNMKLQNTLYSALDYVEGEILRLEELGVIDYSRRPDISARVFYVTQVMTPRQLGALYNLADAYISPYHAEAFNMPVLEAMACGLPIVVPVGGATADFLYAPSAVLIKATEMPLGEYRSGLGMRTGDIALAMRRVVLHKRALKAAALRGVRDHIPRFTWQAIGRRLAFILTDAKHYPKPQHYISCLSAVLGERRPRLRPASNDLKFFPI